jgi:hypothetical protein
MGAMTMRIAGQVPGALLAVVCACGSLFAQQAGLSAAQKAVVEKKTASVSASEKAMIAGWPDSKKLAEFFCSPAGLQAVKKQHPDADRMALGPDDEGVKKFVLTGNTRLSGRGSVRLGGSWKDFTFDCTLDPEKAVATAFTFKLDQ